MHWIAGINLNLRKEKSFSSCSRNNLCFKFLCDWSLWLIHEEDRHVVIKGGMRSIQGQMNRTAYISE
jgi:hypothetical protein